MSLPTSQSIFNSYIDESQKEIESLKKNNEGLQLALANMQNDLENLENQLKESQEEKQFLLLETLQANAKKRVPKIRRSLIVTFLASLIAIANPLLNLGLTLEEVLTIILPLMVYVVIEGVYEVMVR